MTKKIAYFPGCTLKTTASNLEIPAIESAKVLGIEMIEIPKWNCCGVVASLTSDDLMHHLAPIRNMIRVEEMNEKGELDDYRMLTLCSMCYNTLKKSNKRIKENQEEMDALNDFMYLEDGYEGKVEVVHLLEILREIGFDKVKEKVEKRLEGLKVAPYYGCMLLRPKEVGLDDPEAPQILEDFVESIGADAIDFDAMHRCCGSYHTVTDKDIVITLAKDIIENAHKFGADCMITTCPLCAFNLDSRQMEIQEQYPDFQTMPIFYFSQLLAIALGLPEDKWGFEKNYVDPKPLLKEKNII